MIKKIVVNKQRSFFSWLFIFLLVSGCRSNTDQNLNNKIRTWAPYQANQELNFRNENADFLKFKIKRINRTESGHDKVCGSYAIETAETILINQADTTFQFKIVLTQEVLVKLDAYKVQPAAKNLSAMFNSVSEQFISNDWRDQYLPEITLNGKVYKNVLHVYANWPLAGTSFSEIYYAQNVGLIAFNDVNGIWYYLE